MAEPLKLPPNLTESQAKACNEVLTLMLRIEGLRDKCKGDQLPVVAEFLNEARNILDLGLRKQLAAYGHPQAGLFA